MATIDSVPFEINGQTFEPGDDVVVDYRYAGRNDQVAGHFLGTIDVGLGVGIVVHDLEEDGDEVVILAGELIAIATADDYSAEQMAQIAAVSR